MYKWVFTARDNGGKFQVINVKAPNKTVALDKGFARAKKHAKGDITSWDCKLATIFPC